MNQALRYLRIADMELFITAAHLKNLGKAAMMHNLSQSAASAAIMRVENAFGYDLCMHEKRHFRLTREGTSLLPRIEEWIKEFGETVMTETPSPIRLATTHAIARVVIPDVLPLEQVELQLMRPDLAYGCVFKDEADLAIVTDNAPWEGVTSSEIATGSFQLYSSSRDAPLGPVLLPENQIEVLHFMQKWTQTYKTTLPIKARIPSWSLIADICTSSKDIGFLPEFLAKKVGLHPVSWQPSALRYRLLALYRPSKGPFQTRLTELIKHCANVLGQAP